MLNKGKRVFDRDRFSVRLSRTCEKDCECGIVSGTMAIDSENESGNRSKGNGKCMNEESERTSYSLQLLFIVRTKIHVFCYIGKKKK